MEDRMYSNRYYINRPPKSNKKRKSWIYVGVSSMFILLVGIVLLVLFLVPKHKLPASGLHVLKMAEDKVGNGAMFPGKSTTLRPRRFKPSPKDPILYAIDPRSDFLDETELPTSTSSRLQANTSTNGILDVLNTPSGVITTFSSTIETKSSRTNARFNTSFIW